MAVVQLRRATTDGRRYFDRRLAEGKTPMEAMRDQSRQNLDVPVRSVHADPLPIGD